MPAFARPSFPEQCFLPLPFCSEQPFVSGLAVVSPGSEH